MPSALCLCDLAEAENFADQLKFEKRRFSLESAAVEGTSRRGVKDHFSTWHCDAGQILL